MLYPDFYYDSIFHIPYKSLYEQGLRGLVYDIDNTLAGYEDRQPPARILSLISELHEIGFQVGLLSNNHSGRLNTFNKTMKLPGASLAAKPFTSALKRVMREMHVEQHETAIVGDQLLADIWCGKRAGITTILVKPMTEREVITVILKRLPEQWLLKRYLRSRTNPSKPPAKQL